MIATVLGLGEAGTLYAQGLLAAGHQVRGYDPFASSTPAGVDRFETIAEAVTGVEVVLSLTGARASARVAADAAPHLSVGATYIDMNVASAETKRAVAAPVTAVGALFADVAVVGPVPLHGAKTPVVISGGGRDTAAELFEKLGADVEIASAEPGDASNRKLLRSVFMKGLASVITEALDAGEAAGARDWVKDQMRAELVLGDKIIDRLYDGTIKHASRRGHELRDAAEQLKSLGVEPIVTTAAARLHECRADEDADRVSDETLAVFAAQSAAATGDAMDRLGLLPAAISPVYPITRVIVGRALTVWVRAGDNRGLHEALEHAQPGDFMIVNGEGDESRALLGELLAERSLAKGIVGAVIDGSVRDVDVLREIGFPVWARGLTPAGPFKHGPSRVGEAVSVGGVVAHPGDVIVADNDGVAIVPRDHAVRIAQAARAVTERESATRRAIRAGTAASAVGAR
jgi:4-hydroxy-4-methyl-2-oxoglutarate aldolase